MGLFCFTILIILLGFSLASSETNNVKTFIVSVDNALKPSEFSDIDQWYNSILEILSSNSSSSNHKTKKILYTYKTVFHGFSTKLTPQQAQELGKRPEILRLFPEHVYHLQTTRTPQFLGLRPKGPVNIIKSIQSKYGSDVIIGVLDTGIWPERQSFSDEGMHPIPPEWKGECQGGENFAQSLCNKKLIGARFFNVSDAYIKSARDYHGHGSHTASTAAGAAVNNATFFGFAMGTAEGVAPKARLAMYKVCGMQFCSGSDILAGFDSAVEDGVHVISISIGFVWAEPLIEDEIAIGSFGAMEKGITVSASAGNSGPSNATVCNIAPWLITVGASTIDRNFPADLLLENGTLITGLSLYAGNAFPDNQYWPLVFAGNASFNNSDSGCDIGSLKEERVRGKIVVCDVSFVPNVRKGLVVKDAGGVGVVVANVASSGGVLRSNAHLIPGLSIDETARQQVLDYIASSPYPRATMVFRGTHVGVKPAPVIADFSSRGRNTQSMYVMKPDVIAPGVEILAAWSNATSPTLLPEDPRRTEFNIISGTSMSCPHVSGIAALLKGAHKNWSPAMIKSAIMTTANSIDQDGNPIRAEKHKERSTIWHMGSGHVDPQKALNPGLVYDLSFENYVNFLCASNMSEKDIKVITRRSVKCKQSNPWDINYPAISVAFEASAPKMKEIAVKRTVTHVSDEKSSYTVIVKSPNGVTATVDPQRMDFKSEGEKLSYMVRFTLKEDEVHAAATSEFGQLTWTDGRHNVTSPLIITWY